MGERSADRLVIRAYRGERDIQAITALLNAGAEVDGPEEGRSQDEVRLALTSPTALAEENVFLFEVEGQLVAYGRVELEEGPEHSQFVLRGMVHPDWRRRGVGTRVMERLEQRVEERLGDAKTQAVFIVAVTDLKHEDRQALFRSLGYQIVRYFFDMERPLREEGTAVPLPAPAYPPGIVVRTLTERPDLPAVWRTTNEAFRDHWGYTETTLEQWQHWVSYPDHRPELWLVAWDAADEPVGVCLSGIDPDYNARVGREEGWIYVLAVRRPHRRQGLGRALLLAGMGALQQAGVDWAMLGVDSENLTGALRLYESVGFRPVEKLAAFRKTLRS
jgi:mycothiol synthase